MSTVITAGNATNGLSLTADNAGTFEFKTGTGAGTTALSIDASQVTTFAAGVSGTTGSFSGNMSFNSGYGSAAVAYGCRAWVNFNGTGTVAIRASGNVSSITDNGTGDYTVNFTTAMSDANYSSVVNVSAVYGSFYTGGPNINTGTGSATEFAPTTTAFRMITYYISGGINDAKYVNAAVFR